MGKKDLLIEESNKIINAYPDLKLTLRQIYYRLVAKQIIENKITEYKGLSKALVDGRKSGLVSINAIEDRTRNVQSNQNPYEPYRKMFNRFVDRLLSSEKYYWHTKQLYQQDRVIILLEKQALEGIFQDVCNSNDVTLVVCRGYNSLTQLYELKNELQDETKKIHIKFFSDFDPSGLDIQRNFKTQIEELGIKFESFERIALTEELIHQYHLPEAPVKSTDSRSKNWTGGVVELDALEPNVLKELIQTNIDKHFDTEILKRVITLNKSLKRILRRKVDIYRTEIEEMKYNI